MLEISAIKERPVVRDHKIEVGTTMMVTIACDHRIIDGIVACRFLLFFFSSRRRHTRFDCDWSSDVCSSDLTSATALRTPSFRAVADVYGTPNLFRASVAIRVRPARGPAVDNRALFVVPAAVPTRASWSTTHLTDLPARVPWTRSHTALASVFAMTLLIDAAQTRELARQGWVGFREANPLLGERPSVGRVNTYTALAGLSVLCAAAALPPRVRPWLLAAAIAVHAFTIHSSMRQEIGRAHV